MSIQKVGYPYFYKNIKVIQGVKLVGPSPALGYMFITVNQSLASPEAHRFVSVSMCWWHRVPAAR